MQKEKYVTPLPLEAVDQLRVERQSVNPEMFVYARSISTIISCEFNEKYGAYLDERTIRRNKNVAERILIGDDIGYDFNAWAGYEHTGYLSHKGDDLDGHTGPDHGILYIMDPIQAWDRLPSEIKQSYVETCGEFATEEYVAAFLSQTIMHEMTHLYQPTSLSFAVSEMSARFVEVELTEVLETGFIRNGLDHVFINGFEVLCDEFGRDTVLRHTFGTLKDFALSHEIDRTAKGYLDALSRIH